MCILFFFGFFELFPSSCNVVSSCKYLFIDINSDIFKNVYLFKNVFIATDIFRIVLIGIDNDISKNGLIVSVTIF